MSYGHRHAHLIAVSHWQQRLAEVVGLTDAHTIWLHSIGIEAFLKGEPWVGPCAQVIRQVMFPISVLVRLARVGVGHVCKAYCRGKVVAYSWCPSAEVGVDKYLHAPRDGEGALNIGKRGRDLRLPQP